MKRLLLSTLALLLMAVGCAVAQNTNSMNVHQLTRTASGTWVLDAMPNYNGVLEVSYNEPYRLDSIPLTWSVTVNGVDKTQQVTAYTAEEGNTTLGWLNILENDTVMLIPPTAVKPHVRSVTLVDNSPVSDEPVTLSTALTLKALTTGTIVVQRPQSGMQYSKNGGAKTPVTSDAISVTAGDKVSFYGNDTNINNYFYFETKISGGTAEVIVYGNIMSLVDETGYETSTTMTKSAFRELFKGNDKLTDASNLLLPVTTLTNYCYSEMFAGCIGLTAAPVLPATTLAVGCYGSMFNGCSSLTAAPELPATTMDVGCYASMFNGCIALTIPPSLPATILAENCYGSMFRGCSVLTTAPALPATTLAQSCYSYMFENCIALTTAPALPATTLSNYCYRNMFDGCVALTTAPVLPAPTLTNICYKMMFQNCTSLNSVTCLATGTDKPNWTIADYCENMLSGVAATGTFTTPSTTNWGGIIPSGWTRVDAQ